MSKITWLHLSDLHFQEEKHQRWDQNIVLKGLVVDVRDRIKSDGLQPNFVIVSGDIAFSGRASEYVLARAFFDELRDVTKLPKERLFLVPGNHDVDRNAFSPGAKAIASSLDSRQAVNEVLMSPEDRKLIFRKLTPYADFVNDYYEGKIVFSDERYFYIQYVGFDEKGVALLGLNSAWLAYGGKEDGGRLALGEHQVRQAIQLAKDADLRIAIMHHPFDLFLEFDQNNCEALLMQTCDFVLHGHLHRTKLVNLTMPDAGAMVIAGGATYDSREYPNTYNFVQLDFENREGIIFLRRYSDERGGFWTKDVMTYKNVIDGQYTFKLPGRLGVAKPKSRRKVPSAPLTISADPKQLETTYLRLVQITSNAMPLGMIDPRAVERTMQKTMDLLPLYVALNTNTMASKEKRRKGKGEPQMRGRNLESGREARPLTAVEAAARKSEPMMVLLGEPGSGKSTFANYLALCLAGARLEHLGQPCPLAGKNWLNCLGKAWTYGPLLPLQIVLRHLAASEWSDGTAAGLMSFVEETLAGHDLIDFIPQLRRQLHEGRVMVMLDGLDEVSDPDKREAVRKAVNDFAATYSKNRYLVTCRSYAYQDPRWQLEGFVAHNLAPFNSDQIGEFIDCWYQEVIRLAWKNKKEAEDLARRLKIAIQRPELAPLAENPLQLTMIASLQFSWGRLPEDRVELYQEMVRLLLVRWQEARLGEVVGVTREVSLGKLETALERVAIIAHRAQEKQEGTADISEAVLRSVLKDYLDGSWDRAGKVVTYIKERTGLLIERTPGVYTFPHRSYQEYLAGSYLTTQPDFPDESKRLIRENYSQWREVVLWSVGVMARLRRMTYAAINAVEALCPRPAPDHTLSEGDWRAAHLAAEGLLEIGVDEIKTHEKYAELLLQIQRRLIALIGRSVSALMERAAAGRTLARLGDSRPGVGVDPKIGLPDIAWCEVPDGSFLMGSDKKNDRGAYDDEMPQRKLELPTFYISRYPVTNAQFEAFIQSNGYHEASYWKEAEAAGMWQAGKVKRRTYRMDKDATKEMMEFSDKPFDFGQPFNLPNHPVVGVTWYEALAFSKWVNEKFQVAASELRVWRDGKLETASLKPEAWKIRLPKEDEWEKAARGTDGRIYPWGDKIDPDKANHDKTGIGATSAVGCFPAGASPYGALDMSGNVLEWCQPKWRDSYKTKADESLEGTGPRVGRGGSWIPDARLIRCACRYRRDPVNGDSSLGFRLVVSPGSP